MRGRKLEAARQGLEFQRRTPPRIRSAAFDPDRRCVDYLSSSWRSLITCHSSLVTFFCRDKLVRSCVKRLLVVFGAKVVRRALEQRLRRDLWIDVHSADSAKWVLRSRNR